MVGDWAKRKDIWNVRWHTCYSQILELRAKRFLFNQVSRVAVSAYSSASTKSNYRKLKPCA
jgi:hypothetical protein